MIENESSAKVCIELSFNTYPTKLKCELEKLGCKVLYLKGARKQTESQSYIFDFTCEAAEGWDLNRLNEEVKIQAETLSFELKEGVYVKK